MTENDLFSPLGRYPELVAAISTKADGNCRLEPTGDVMTDRAVFANRATFLAKLDIPADRVVAAGLVHGGKVRRVTTADDDAPTSLIAGVDALFANERDLFLSVTVADCLPVFFFDPTTKTFGLAHAGWRGLIAGVIPNTIAAMARDCGASAETLLAAIGPGIGACHFEVLDDVARQFAAGFPDANAVLVRDGKTFVDLKAVARAQLAASGVAKEHVAVSGECTFDLAEKYFSWRRDKPAIKTAMMAVIGLK